MKKKNLPIENIDQRNLLFIADQKKKYVYLFVTAVTSSVNFFHTFCNTKSRSIFANKFPDNKQRIIAYSNTIGALFARI
jgi:hypothetical protein